MGVNTSIRREVGRLTVVEYGLSRFNLVSSIGTSPATQIPVALAVASGMALTLAPGISTCDPHQLDANKAPWWRYRKENSKSDPKDDAPKMHCPLRGDRRHLLTTGEIKRVALTVNDLIGDPYSVPLPACQAGS